MKNSDNKDNIELKDIDGVLPKSSEISSNSLRFKKESYNQVTDRYIKFLKSQALATKAEGEHVITEAYEQKKSDIEIENTANEYANVIAELENKIDILEGYSSVPSVSSRAIRLRDNMMKQARANSSEIYKMLAFRSDSNVEVSDTPIDIEKIAEKNKSKIKNDVDGAIGAKEEKFDRNSFDEILRSSLNSLPVEKDVESAENNIGDDDYEYQPMSDEALKESKAKLFGVEKEAKSEDNFAKETDEKITTELNNTDNNILNKEEIEAEINAKLNNINIDVDSIEKEEVEQPAIVSEKEVTDDEKVAEIREQDNINQFNELNHTIEEKDDVETSVDLAGQQIRENVVTVPEREETKTELVDENVNSPEEVVEEYTEVKEEGLHFDYTDATVEDVKKAMPFETSMSGLEALKARAKKLQQEKELSTQARKVAEEAQISAAEMVQKFDEEAQSKKKALDVKEAELETYLKSLEDDIKKDREATELANTETENSKKYILNKEAEIKDYDVKMSEIDSIINPGVSKTM